MPVPAEAGLSVAADGTVLVTGRIGLASIADLAARGPELFAAGGEVSVDFAAVTRADSGALALLLAWQRSARSAGARLNFRNVPPALCAIAEACGVDALLALEPA
jgi:phospholipid transport system transporter-binding protein